MSAQAKRRLFLSRVEIEAGVRRLSAEITSDYQDKQPLLVCVLKGSFIFLADLIRFLDFPLEVDFIRLSSYGGGTQTSGKVKVVQPLRSVIKDKDVLVIEDIVDTGVTTAFLIDYLQSKKPASVKLCALMNKPARRQVPVTVDYLGFTVPNKFIVGYGLDLDEKFRNLPDICVIEG